MPKYPLKEFTCDSCQDISALKVFFWWTYRIQNAQVPAGSISASRYRGISSALDESRRYRLKPLSTMSENPSKRSKLSIPNEDLLAFLVGLCDNIKVAAGSGSHATANFFKASQNFKTVFADAVASARIRGEGALDAMLGVTYTCWRFLRCLINVMATFVFFRIRALVLLIIYLFFCK